MSRRTISRSMKTVKSKEPSVIDPQARHRWEQRQADDTTVIGMIGAGTLDTSTRDYGYYSAVAAQLGWTQGRLHAAIMRVLENVRARWNRREEKNV